MKKNTGVKVAVAVVAAVAIAYPATAWYLGKKIETEQDEAYAAIASNPYVKIVNRDYQRGVFSSTEQVTVALKLPQQYGESVALPQLTFVSKVEHGPFPGFSTSAVGISDTELLFDEKIKADLKKVFGENQPLKIHSKYNFGGDREFSISSPAFTFDAASVSPDETGKVTWGGINITGTYTKSTGRYVLQGEAPNLTVSSDGENLEMVGLKLAADVQRVFEDEPMFFAGTQKLSIAAITVTNANNSEKKVQLKELGFDTISAIDGDFLNSSTKFGSQVIQVGENDFGPAHFDFSINHIHVPTYTKLNRILASMNMEDPGRALVVIQEPLMALLKQQPEFKIDRLTFNTPKGAPMLTAHAKFGEISDDDLKDPLELLGKFEAGADISIPEALVLFADEMNPYAPPSTSAQERLETLVGMGFVTREGEVVKTTVAFSKGELTLNGKPFDPNNVQALEDPHPDDEDLMVDPVEAQPGQ